MFLLVNLFATFGALVLTIMGLAISFTYPIGGQRGHFIWIIAFVVVGIPATVAAYFVSHNYGHTGETTPSTPAVTRLEPNAFTVRPERPAQQMRTEHVRVVYGEHRDDHHNHQHINRPQTVTYDIRQTVPVAPVAIFTSPKRSSVIPPNTFSCVGFTKNPDGTWDAGDSTQPFNVGTAQNIVIRDQGPIEPGWVTVGGVDLYDLLVKKCGAQPAH
jgi:hypothetical protein